MTDHYKETLVRLIQETPSEADMSFGQLMTVLQNETEQPLFYISNEELIKIVREYE